MIYYNAHVKNKQHDIMMLSDEEAGVFYRLWLEANACDGVLSDEYVEWFCRKNHRRKKIILKLFQTFFIRIENGFVHQEILANFEAQKEKSSKARANVQKRWGNTDQKTYGRITDVIPNEYERNTNDNDNDNDKENPLSKKEPFQKNTKKVLAPELQPTVAKNATAQQVGDEVSPPVPPAGDTPPKGGGDIPKKSNSILSKPDDVCEQVWTDYLALRRAKKAPITVTLMKTLRSEADKAKLTLEKALETCINRNWQGFRADWLPSVAAPLPKPKPVFFNPNNAPPLKENVEILGIYNSNEENALADSIKNITRL